MAILFALFTKLYANYLWSTTYIKSMVYDTDFEYI